MVSLNSQATDLCIITEEGEKIYTQRFLLCIYSSSVAKYLSDVPCCNSTSISIPVSSLAFKNLLNILINGFVNSDAFEQLCDVAEAAKILGIELQNIDIGSENDDTNIDESYNMITKTEPGIGQVRRKKKLRKTKTKTEKFMKIVENKTAELEQFEFLSNLNNEQELLKTKKEPFVEENEFKFEYNNGEDDIEKLLDESDGKEKPTCDICGKQYLNISKLNWHKNTHTLEKPFPCNQCEKMFSDNSKLNRHKNTHTGEKPFPCNQCEKMFCDTFMLKRHMMTHTGEKPFACDQCQKSYTRKDKLKAHQNTVHQYIN